MSSTALGRYMERHGIKPPEMASRLGVSLVSVYRYISGERRPEGDVMVRIRTLTGGEVRADDFYPDPAATPETE